VIDCFAVECREAGRFVHTTFGQSGVSR
jgi:hypothetical protein